MHSPFCSVEFDDIESFNIMDDFLNDVVRIESHNLEIKNYHAIEGFLSESTDSSFYDLNVIHKRVIHLAFNWLNVFNSLGKVGMPVDSVAKFAVRYRRQVLSYCLAAIREYLPGGRERYAAHQQLIGMFHISLPIELGSL